MSGQLVLINGPAGVGKTTVGRHLAGTAPNGACIHGDDLKAFVVRRQDGAVGEGLSYLAAAAVADVFLAAGYELVVFEFVFERRQHVDRFISALHSDTDVHLLSLWAPLDMVTAREASRVGRTPLGDRVSACWEAVGANLHDQGAVVDATAPVEQVVLDATRRIVDGAGLIRKAGVAAAPSEDGPQAARSGGVASAPRARVDPQDFNSAGRPVLRLSCAG